jgi:hypothetical protein
MGESVYVREVTGMFMHQRPFHCESMFSLTVPTISVAESQSTGFMATAAEVGPDHTIEAKRQPAPVTAGRGSCRRLNSCWARLLPPAKLVLGATPAAG